MSRVGKLRRDAPRAAHVVLEAFRRCLKTGPKAIKFRGVGIRPQPAEEGIRREVPVSHLGTITLTIPGREISDQQIPR